MNIPRVQNMVSQNSGREIPNQFEIFTPEGKYFQSYSTVIAFRSNDGKITLDREKYDYSRTTAKYRNQFLRMTTKEIEAAIKAGTIILANLN